MMMRAIKMLGTTIAGTSLLMAVVSTAVAQDWFVSPSAPNGHVTGAIDQPASGLYRVEITEINGKLVGSGRSEGVWLKPGDYQIKARGAAVRVDYTAAVGRSSSTRHVAENNEIELTVEEGKTYHLALDTSSPRRSDWEIVVWKVE